jgi:cytochrome c-type biogenesis protein CcmE
MSTAASEVLPGGVPGSPERTRKPWKLLATVLAVSAGVATLITFSLDTAVAQYLELNEAHAHLDKYKGKRLQVHGYVVDGTIAQKPGSLQYRFEIQDNPKDPRSRVVAYYEGIVPDTFKSRAEVVATGVFTDKGDLQIEAGGIMAKCPSRYDGKNVDLSEMGSAKEAAGAPTGSKPQASAASY